MLRYNHGLIERKWSRNWTQERSLQKETVDVCTVLVPAGHEYLDLENARLLVLTDFFAAARLKTEACISIVGAKSSWLCDAESLGLSTQRASGNSEYAFAVLPRDYIVTARGLQAQDILTCGRLLQAGSLQDFLPDFGIDALRIYFLYLGPPERDYVFRWHGLTSAYRFVDKVWQLGQRYFDERDPDLVEYERIEALRMQVKSRIMQRKPHTALAAIMGYLKDKSKLTQIEIIGIARLLQPFTPFLSAELLDLVSAVKDDNGR